MARKARALAFGILMLHQRTIFITVSTLVRVFSLGVSLVDRSTRPLKPTRNGAILAESKRFRDKAHMKDIFTAAGIPCARHKLCNSADEAVAFGDF